MRLGEFELTSVLDGTFRLDGGQMFGIVPKTLWQRRAPADADNRIPLALRPLLVRTGTHTVLIDTGIGGKMDAHARAIYAIAREPDALVRALAATGVTPADVDLVILTHLHFDHAGGCTTIVDGAIAPVFPRARHLVRRGEWNAATHPNARTRASYLAENFLPLAEAGLVDFIDDDTEVLPGLTLRRTGGHTADHQIVSIASGGRTAIFAADLIPTTAHVDAPWILGFDLYPLETLAYKTRLLPEAIEGEYVIVFEHDPAMAAGVLRRDGKRVVVEPVAL